MGDVPPALEPDEIFAALNRHGVRYIVIGGLAGLLHGSGLTTVDVDISPARDDENLLRLARALTDLEAKLRVPQGSAVAFPIEASFLGQMTLMTLRTRAGDLDICFEVAGPGPQGTLTYADLEPNAVRIDIGQPVLVASLADVIRSKEAAGRDKDLTTLPTLRRLRNLLENGQSDGR